jgi:hypothetical protein
MAVLALALALVLRLRQPEAKNRQNARNPKQSLILQRLFHTLDKGTMRKRPAHS